MMRVAPNADQAQFRDLIRRVIADLDAAPIGNSGGRDAALSRRQAFAGVGLFGLTVPESEGGFASEREDLAIASFELGRAPRLTPRLEQVVLASHLILSSASPSRQALIDGLVSGTAVPAVALWEEPNAFALSDIITSARRDADGYRLCGRKICVLGGSECDLLLVSAWLDQGAAPRLALFAVPARVAGLSVRAYDLIDLSAAADITLDDVQLPPSSLLNPDVGEALSDAIDEAMITLCAGLVGSMERSIELTIAHLKLREQFGRPLAQFQALQHQVADSYIAADNARSSVYAALAARNADPAAARRVVAGCKVKVTLAARAAIGQALHLHGGIGFTSEYPIGHHYLRAIVDEKLLGDSEYHLARHMTLARGDCPTVARAEPAGADSEVLLP